jgi:hypothetical protein
MAINEHDNFVIKKKVQVIQQLIRHSKDAKLQRQLEGILEDQQRLFGTRKTYANAASIRKQKDEFLVDLDTFRRWVFKRSKLSLSYLKKKRDSIEGTIKLLFVY